MQAYEFYAMPENGALIIPKEYLSKINSRVKVILLQNNPEALDSIENKEQRRTESLSPVSINTLGWKFDKEEANER